MAWSSGLAETPRPERVRYPAAAGWFYPADPVECSALARSYLRPRPPTGPAWRGAIVPHAGWVCSGAIAGEAIATLAGAGAVGAGAAPVGPARAVTGIVVVIFGAIHTPLAASAAMLSSHHAWREPGSDSAVAVEVRAKLAESGGPFAVDDRFHLHEHAIEVELPLVQAAWPGSLILPVEVPAFDEAPDVGRRTARQLAAAGVTAFYLASSDLTHYGPAYRFTPAGVGPRGLAWARDNDRRLLDRVLALDADGIVPEAREHHNACGGGAIAAMLAACRETGAATAKLLRHANSIETLADVRPQAGTDAVGYAGLVVG